MNPLFHHAADTASSGLLMGLVTVAFFAFFTVVFFRMFRPGAGALYTEAAQIPLTDEYPMEVRRG